MKKRFLPLMAMSVMLVTGCVHFGAHNLPPDRIRYNKSVISSDLQQAILNLVRLRYGDTPNFLSLNNIVSQFTLDTSVSADLSRTDLLESITNFIQITPKVGLSETPTITYTPMQGEEFVKRLMTPVDVKVVKVLLRDGWGIGRVFRTFFQRLGPFENAVVASRPTSHRVPVYKRFSKLTHVLRILQTHEALLVKNDNDLDVYRMRFDILSFKHLKPDEKRFLATYGITPKTPNFWITTDEDSKLPRNFWGETRTMLSIYSYLSKGVEIPIQDYNVADVVKNKDGSIFDWHLVVGGLITIKYCKTLPRTPYIYVFYRGYYFYVDDTDENSKEGLNLLMILNGIFQGNIQSVLPVFTVS
jgi:hypothetical protein